MFDNAIVILFKKGMFSTPVFKAALSSNAFSIYITIIVSVLVIQLTETLIGFRNLFRLIEKTILIFVETTHAIFILFILFGHITVNIAFFSSVLQYMFGLPMLLLGDF